MTAHFTLMLVFSILVSLVFAFIGKEGTRERAKYFLYLLGSFVLLSLVASWLMYPFPIK
jgi:hypothetical protein